MPHIDHGFQTGNDLFGNKRFVVTKSRESERGQLLKYFAQKTGKPIGYIAFRLTKVPTGDLYHIQKTCDAYDGAWSKCFFGMLKPKNEEPKNH